MWGRMYLLFWKKSCFSFRLPTSRLFCGFRQIFFGSVVKNEFYVSKENFWGKTLFSWEKICFFNIFGLWSIFLPLFQLFGGDVKTAFQEPKCFSRKISENVFCYSWAWSKEIWSFFEDFPAGLSNFILRVHRNFWGIIQFSGRSRFFSIIFEHSVNLFWRSRHNCMLRVQIQFEVKWNFPKEKFLSLSDNEREISRRSEKSFGRESQRQSNCSKGWLQTKVCYKKIFFFIAFVPWGKDFLLSGKKNWQSVTNAIYVFMGTVCWKILFEKFLFFYGFWTFRDNIPASCRKFLQTAVRIAF